MRPHKSNKFPADTGSRTTIGLASVQSIPQCHLLMNIKVVSQFQGKLCSSSVTGGFFSHRYCEFSFSSLPWPLGSSQIKSAASPGNYTRLYAWFYKPNYSDFILFPTHISFGHNSYIYTFYCIITYKLLQILSEMRFGIFELIHNKKATVLKELTVLRARVTYTKCRGAV